MKHHTGYSLYVVPLSTERPKNSQWGSRYSLMDTLVFGSGILLIGPCALRTKERKTLKVVKSQNE